jgi:hypothetical protein
MANTARSFRTLAQSGHDGGAVKLFACVLTAAVLVGACSGQGTHAAASSSATTIATASPSRAASPAASTTPVVASLTCEIPFVSSSEFVSSGRQMYDLEQGTPGFLKLPEGSFRPDPNGAMTVGSNGRYHTVVKPILPGDSNSGLWWDGPANRWLAVPSLQVSPDGTSYVYNLGPEVHQVTVATGADRLLFRQPSGLPPVNLFGLASRLVYRGDGVYLSVNDHYKGPGGSILPVPAGQIGLWRLDPGGAAPQRLLTQSVGGSSFMVTDMVGHHTVLWTVENLRTLVRYDLASTRKDAWFSDPGRLMDILGVDPTGNPIVWTFEGGLTKIWLVSGPNAGNTFYSETYAYPSGGPTIYGVNLYGFPLAVDRHGVWFGASTGLFLYDATGFHKVADVPGIPVGPCQ